jgi:glycerate kinase
MKVVIAPDSFKESMSAVEAAAAIARGVRSVVPGADCELVRMAPRRARQTPSLLPSAVPSARYGRRTRWADL